VSDRRSTGNPPVAPIIVFWPWATGPAASRTLSVALEGTPRTAPVVLPDDPAGRSLLAAFPDEHRERLSLLAVERSGLAELIAAAIAAHPRADLAIIADACELGTGWLERLQAAARADDTVAISSVVPVDPARPDPLDPTCASEAPDPVRRARAPAGLAPDPAGCLIHGTTLELLGPPEERWGHPAAVLADLAARAQERGFRSALVADASAVRLEGGLDPCPPAECDSLREVHPWLEDALRDERALDAGPQRRQLVAARARRNGMSVTVDARSLGTGFGGTQTYVASLLTELARADSLSVRAVIAGDLEPELRDTLERSNVVLVDYADAASSRLPRTDVVHRPQQVFSPSDLRLLGLVGERLVVSHMDLIAYRAANYHDSVDTWLSYRRTSRIALASADHVLFFSDHARRDALTEDLVPAERTSVAGIGVSAPAADATARRPPAIPEDDREMLLMLGADYLHKNRPFAIRLLDELRRRHGWRGRLVFAGAHVRNGSSAAAETDLLAFAPELRDAVIDLGPVTEEEKRWLMQAAVAHLAPSSFEGFGLAPLEAAAVGRPCLFAAVTSLAETIDPAAATIAPWDPVASADAVHELLRPGPARERNLGLLDQALARNTWDRLIPVVIGAYEEAIASPYRGALERAQQELEREELIVALDSHGKEMDRRCIELDQFGAALNARVAELDQHGAALDARLAELDQQYQDLLERVTGGMPLIDARDPLLTPAQQRGLMRVASRRWLKRPLLGGFGLLGSVMATTDVGDPERRRSGGRGTIGP
jgi:hypothetical protein